MMFAQTAKRWSLLLVLSTSIALSAHGRKTIPTFVSSIGPSDVLSTTIHKPTTTTTKLNLASNNNNNKNNDPPAWTKTRQVQWKTRNVPEPTTTRTRQVSPPPTSSKNSPKSSSLTPSFSLEKEKEESSELVKLDELTFQEYMETTWSNMAGGTPGKRGELYFGAQTALVLLVLVGELPLVGDPLKFALGSGAIFGGVGAIIAGVVELGDQLSAWPVPATSSSSQKKEDGLIVDTGIYSLVRHPIYAGLISICGGLGFVTDSTVRIFFTILLYYCLEKKSEFEEGKIIEEDPSYILYREEVRGKFIPHEIVEALPWEEKR